MTDGPKPMALDGLKMYPLADRKSKVSATDFGSPWQAGGTFKHFLEGLPSILAGEDLRVVISSITTAYREKKSVLLAMGAHVIKVGLNPVIIDLMRRGIITGIAMNGAGIIHDLEVAMTGQTSEDVSAALGDGSFGMARETGNFLNDAIRSARIGKLGLGHAVGKKILEEDLPLKQNSILASGVERNIPVTVHVAIGTDIIHMHPDFDAEAAGGATHLDFRIFSSMVSSLEDGVYLNVGSAVILPEVFLKALSVVRNLGHPVHRFTAVNLDFIRHYRPMTNVVHRPTAEGGKGISLVGHHELLLPMIAAGVLEELDLLDFSSGKD